MSRSRRASDPFVGRGRLCPHGKRSETGGVGAASRGAGPRGCGRSRSWGQSVRGTREPVTLPDFSGRALATSATVTTLRWLARSRRRRAVAQRAGRRVSWAPAARLGDAQQLPLDDVFAAGGITSRRLLLCSLAGERHRRRRSRLLQSSQSSSITSCERLIHSRLDLWSPRFADAPEEFAAGQIMAGSKVASSFRFFAHPRNGRACGLLSRAIGQPEARRWKHKLMVEGTYAICEFT